MYFPNRDGLGTLPTLYVCGTSFEAVWRFAWIPAASNRKDEAACGVPGTDWRYCNKMADCRFFFRKSKRIDAAEWTGNASAGWVGTAAGSVIGCHAHGSFIHSFIHFFIACAWHERCHHCLLRQQGSIYYDTTHTQRHTKIKKKHLGFSGVFPLTLAQYIFTYLLTQCTKIRNRL